ncbi:16S rRNA (guanine(966)-N(2))-methyltransferase RsmD [Cereibacter azotoformans]|uniref:16S rRNA (guanine(966)-N(2))-methyltransferase RsmD n=1 Tax=Cereibacter azotoformans TaxID=43057 RepID=UPI001EEAD57F|nr:16S rRNA (guanine(966)-N(2))-methyltransferase RsmD [Cereibacter azotoformans]ULB10836.1 16S rRNA (guanine(966)-N(2))-methyltransferase RsmD [Cereibacter azotoformans]
MRIIGGQKRGLKLAEVGEGDVRAHLRPTSDRVREAIFNLLINGGYGNPVAGARVLDLFAGTGALGLEALSRGAGHAILVESGPPALALLKRNIALMQAEDRTAIERRDATRPAPAPAAPVTLCFLDPPYGKGMGEKALAAHSGWLAPGAIIVWEENHPPAPPAGFTQLDQRRYGDTLVTLLEAP